MARNNTKQKCTSTAVLVDPDDEAIARLSEFFLPSARMFDFLDGARLSPAAAAHLLDRHIVTHKRCQHSAKGAILLERDRAAAR